MARLVQIVAMLLLFSAGFLAALAAWPICPDPHRHICFFSDVKLEAIKPTASTPPVSTSSFQCPVSGQITGTIGTRHANLNGDIRMRTGIEISVPEGTPVKAPARGKVKISKPDLLGPGIHVVIEHSANPLIESTIGYLQQAKVREGDVITNPGQEIGTSGKNPATGNPAIYFELRRGGLIQRDVEDICRNKAPAPVKTAASICPQYDALFNKYIAKHNAQSILSAAIVGGVAYTESGCNPNPSNGQGIMQVVKCETQGCSLEQNIDYGVAELVQNFKNIQAKGVASTKDAWTLVFFGYNRGVGTVDKAIGLNKQGTPLKQAMVQACYSYFDQGSYGGCGGFGREACCNSPGLGAQYPDRIFANIPSAARPA